MESVEEKVRKFIVDNILFSSNGYPYPDDVSFLENGIIDSMNIMEIVLYAEESFGIKVNDDEIVPANFDSVSALANYVRSKQVATV
jgi:acyl carrier protein